MSFSVFLLNEKLMTKCKSLMRYFLYDQAIFLTIRYKFKIKILTIQKIKFNVICSK